MIKLNKKILKMILFVFIAIITVIAVYTVSYLFFSPQFGAKSKGEYAERINNSPNFKDEVFKNLEIPQISIDIKFSTFFKFFTRGDKYPPHSLPYQKIDPQSFNTLADSLTRVTWFGHSAVLLELDGKKIMFDPMLSNNSGPHPLFAPKRFSDNLPIEIEALPALDAVLISHDHYDHLDYETIIKINDKVKQFIVPLGVASHLISWGVDKNKIVELDWWETTNIADISIVSTPTQHFSGRGLTDRNSTLWCSWVIKGKNVNLFYSGDSGYNQAFKKIGELYGPFALTMLECGQYNEQWHQVHMMPEESVQANIDLKGNLMMPIHWGAFSISLHNWDDPIERVTRKAKELGVKLTTPMLGEQIILSSNEPDSVWWIE